MLVQNVTHRNILSALDFTGHVEIPELRGVNKKGTSFRFTLRPAGKDRYYGRKSLSEAMTGKARKVHAVCWHGYRDFLSNLFRVAPDAVVKTSLATYRGVKDFEEKFPDTLYTELNSYYGITVADGCDCHYSDCRYQNYHSDV